MQIKIFLVFTASLLILSGCAAPTANIEASKVEAEKVTVGSAQRLRKGMSDATVAEILGTPNLITTNDDGTITWVYDKTSSFAEAIVGTEIFRDSGVAVSGSKTLMIYVVFNMESKIEEFKFRATSY